MTSIPLLNSQKDTNDITNTTNMYLFVQPLIHVYLIHLMYHMTYTQLSLIIGTLNIHTILITTTTVRTGHALRYLASRLANVIREAGKEAD